MIAAALLSEHEQERVADIRARRRAAGTRSPAVTTGLSRNQEAGP